MKRICVSVHRYGVPEAHFKLPINNGRLFAVACSAASLPGGRGALWLKIDNRDGIDAIRKRLERNANLNRLIC